MTRYIDKAAVVAEIEKIRRIEVTNNDVVYNGALDEIRHYVDTLEVKGADFKIQDDCLWISRNAIEKLRQYYKKAASNEPAPHNMYYERMADVFTDMFKCFESPEL